MIDHRKRCLQVTASIFHYNVCLVVQLSKRERKRDKILRRGRVKVKKLEDGGRFTGGKYRVHKERKEQDRHFQQQWSSIKCTSCQAIFFFFDEAYHSKGMYR